MGCDLVPPKLVKVAADQLAEPLMCIINSGITQSIFPNKAKRGSFTPIDKGRNDKHIFSNYIPVSVYWIHFPELLNYQFFYQITMCLYVNFRNGELILIKTN